MAIGNAPQVVAMGLQKEYAKRYDWLVKEFTDWAFTFMTSFLYYMDYDTIDEQTRSLYHQGISAFGGIAPTYRIALENEFCSQSCKNQFNVYKSREKKKGNKRDD